jgi:hypothetical protein
MPGYGMSPYYHVIFLNGTGWCSFRNCSQQRSADAYYLLRRPPQRLQGGPDLGGVRAWGHIRLPLLSTAQALYTGFSIIFSRCFFESDDRISP